MPVGRRGVGTLSGAFIPLDWQRRGCCSPCHWLKDEDEPNADQKRNQEMADAPLKLKLLLNEKAVQVNVGLAAFVKFLNQLGIRIGHGDSG